MALVELQNQGILKYLISQNCDGLHRRSGILPVSLYRQIYDVWLVIEKDTATYRIKYPSFTATAIGNTARTVGRSTSGVGIAALPML